MKHFKKTLFCLLALCALAACLTACGGNTPDAKLLVGFGRADITPEERVSLHGYGNYDARISNEVVDRLYATCLAFTDAADNTVLIFSMDLGTCNFVYARKAVSEATGVPYDNIMMSATHTHSGPSITKEDRPEIARYLELLTQRCVEAATAAMADRQEARMFGGSKNLTGLNFVRHYVLSDGTVVGDGFGNDTGDYMGHVHAPDNEMQVVRFTRDGKKDIVMANWQCHATRVGNSGADARISSDFIGPMRDYIEPQLNCDFIYISGASGNLSPASRIASENTSSNHRQQGQQLAQGAIQALSGAVELSPGNVQIQYMDVPIKIKKNESNMSMAAMSFGDLGMASAPYEMFDTNGKFVKENSPFPMTFIMSFGNSCAGYVAEESAYRYGGYEVNYIGYNKGTAEDLASGLVTILDNLHTTRNTGAVSASPAEKLPVYWNLSKGKELAADADGSYTLEFVCDGQLKQLRCADSQLVTYLQLQDVICLELEGDTITAARPVADCGYAWPGWNYFVKSIGGGKVKINSNKGFNGSETMLTLTDDTKVYNVSSLATTPGEITELQKNDGVTVFADEEDNAVLIFVSERAAVAEEGKRYCQHCETDVQWYQWHSDSQIPSGGGHYVLMEDVTLLSTTNMGSVETVVDLNGKRVEQTVDGCRIYNITGSTGKLSILDSVGTGVMRPANTYMTGNYEAHWGLIVNMVGSDCEFNLYSGTLDASGISTQYGGAINSDYGTINMYGGTILGAEPYGTGSGAVRAGGVFNLYDGRIVGGTSQNIGYVSINIHGGATIRADGIFNMYGGMIEGGNCYTDGGIIYVSGTANLYGGTITGGKSDTHGSGMFAASGSTVTISGDIQITGNEGDNLCLDRFANLIIDEGNLNGAKVGITALNPGELSACTDPMALQCLVSDDPTLKLSLKNGMLYLG